MLNPTDLDFIPTLQYHGSDLGHIAIDQTS